jgi:outer membrane lipoprotein carrier protein
MGRSRVTWSAHRGVLALVLAVASPLALAAGPATSAVGGAAPLDEFLAGLHSLRADFSQEVTAAHGRVVSQSTGEITVLRPGRFRWQIRPVGEAGAGQLLVADGRNLWYYDSDLQQVTVRRESTALTATPAMLLSGGARALSAFAVSGDGRRDGLDWVRVVPKAADADFKEALLGFSGRELKRMILEDKLGQTATLTFEHAERNVPVAASEVTFTPPPGADVIGTPYK